MCRHLEVDTVCARVCVNVLICHHIESPYIYYK